MPAQLIRSVLAAAAAAACLPALAQEVTLKFHHIWPPAAMAPTKVIGPWCDKIAAESGNRLKCQLLPAMSGGGTPPQLVDRVKDGVDDLTITLPGYTAGRFPMMEVFELPFMTNSAEAGAAAAWDYLQKHALKEFPGTKVLATWVHDEGYVHTSGKQIKSLDDFKGLKMRAPTRQTNKLLARLGATPVGMPVTGVADALSKGTIDGFALPWEVIPAFKLHEMTKFHTQTDPSRPALYSAGFIRRSSTTTAAPRCRARSAGSGTKARPSAARRRRTAATPSSRCRPPRPTPGSRPRPRSTKNGWPTWTSAASTARRCCRTPASCSSSTASDRPGLKPPSAGPVPALSCRSP